MVFTPSQNEGKFYNPNACCIPWLLSGVIARGEAMSLPPALKIFAASGSLMA